MIKKFFLTVSAAVMLAAVSSCGKLDPLTADNFVCNPNPLVEEGGQVNATVTVTYPEKYFNKKASITITPVLEYATGETAGTPVTFQGEKVSGNDQEINYKYGGTGTFRCSFLYKPEMATSKLRLDFTAYLKDKAITLPSVYIADGVIATESLCSAYSNTPAYAKDNFVKDTFDKYIATMIYQYQSTNLRASESNKKQEIKDLQDAITATKDQDRRQFEGLDMVSTASPEGSYSLNERLAAGREKSSAAYLNKFLKKAKMQGEITPEQIAEDWEGFKELVENSSIQDKQLVLNVLGRISDPDRREQEIRNLSAAYKELEDEILPQLRYSKVTATVRNIGHTDDEIADLWKNGKDELTLEELLYLANMSKDDAKEAIYKYAQNKFGSDVRAANDLADLYYTQGKTDEAEKLWKNILNKDANNPQANLNMGLVAMNNGDWQAAQTYLGKAADCPEYGEAMGTLLTNKGQYAQAVQSFGDAKTNNAAVANLLNKNYSAAKSILDNIKNKDAMTYYLSAIVAARTNNASGVTENLKMAIGLDSSFKAKALGDLEFAKFASALSNL
jgi:Tfp pilus assembly protein PilF